MQNSSCYYGGYQEMPIGISLYFTRNLAIDIGLLYQQMSAAIAVLFQKMLLGVMWEEREKLCLYAFQLQDLLQ